MATGAVSALPGLVDVVASNRKRVVHAHGECIKAFTDLEANEVGSVDELLGSAQRGAEHA